MIGRKLFKILGSLSVEEFSQLKKAIQSPIFGNYQSLIPLYEYLRRYYPEFNDPNLNGSNMYTSLYPGKPLKEGVLRVKIRQFTKLAEDFLVWLQIRGNDFKYQNLLTAAYGSRNLYTYFEKELTELLKEQAEQPFRDVEYFQSVVELNSSYYFHPSTEKHSLDDQNLVSLMDHMDKQFVLMKLRVGTEMKSRQKTLGINYTIPLLSTVLENGNASFMEGNMPFQLYQLLFQLYEADDPESVYYNTKELLVENIAQLRKFDRSLIITQLINYTVRQINSGFYHYYKEAFSLHQLALVYNLIMEHNMIHEGVFGNIVILGCYSGAFQWTTTFIENYKAYLKEEIREDVAALHMGLLYFYQNDFEKANAQFTNYPFAPFYEPKARFNLIRTIYEQFLANKDLHPFLIDKIIAFEKHLHRNRIISAYHKETYRNAVLIIKKLANGIFKRKAMTALKLTLNKELAKKERIIAKDWLKNKIDQLA